MRSLRGLHVLILEDEYFLAEELVRILDVEGALVIGPFSALEQLKPVPLDQVDAAVLNVRVRDGLSYELATRLRERNIPFVFASGQERTAEPAEWHGNEWVSKPYEARRLIAALHRVMGRVQEL